MANDLFKGVVELPNDEAHKTLVDTGSYTDADGKTVTYDPNWLYVTPNTVASNVAQQKLQIEDLYSKLNNTVTLDSVQTITGPKTFRESIYLANADGTTDRIAHINNNFIIYSGANNGVALLNIDEGLGKISAFNKELAFKEDLINMGGGTGNTTVYVGNYAVDNLYFDSDPQTQISSKAKQEDLDEIETKFDEYLPLTAGIDKKLTGDLYVQDGANTKNIYLGAYSRFRDNGSGGLVISTNGTFYLRAAGDGGYATGLTLDKIALKPQTDEGNSLGTSTGKWKEIHGTTIYQNGNKVLDVSGGTLNGGLSVNGNLTIIGDITQQGGSYITHAEQVYSTKDYIYLRDGNTGALANNAYTGFEFIKYDGTNNGRLVVDNKGIARVGDVGDEQPLATREETPIDGGFAKWDASSSKFITTKETIPTSIDGMSGGTLTSPLNITGNNKNSASIVMGSNGQILDGSVENYAIFGRSGGNILIGAVPYIMQMRGKNARPTYRPNGGTETEMALLSDIPNELLKSITTDNDKITITDQSDNTIDFANIQYLGSFTINTQNGETLASIEELNNCRNPGVYLFNVQKNSGGLGPELCAYLMVVHLSLWEVQRIIDLNNLTTYFRSYFNNAWTEFTINTTDYLPLSAGSDKPLSGILYANNGVRISSNSAMRFEAEAKFITPHKVIRFGSSSDNNSDLLVMTQSYLRPNGNDTNLGNSSHQWKEIYGKTIYQDGKQVANKEDIPKLGTTNWSVTQDSNGNLVFTYA